MTSIVALIPARAGSKRIPNKNTKELAGHPLIAYTIAAAKQSGVFSQVWVCSDSWDILHLGQRYGVASMKRLESTDSEPDIEWMRTTLDCLSEPLQQSPEPDAFAILRPTSPFRTTETIKRAWNEWLWAHSDMYYCAYDSLRAMEPVRQHPAKMWTLSKVSRYYAAVPLLLQPSPQPWHSSPTQTLPKVYVQNASLEIAWVDTVRRTGTIAGDRILAFETKGWEGFDINTEQDWWVAERAIAEGVAKLPEVE